MANLLNTIDIDGLKKFVSVNAQIRSADIEGQMLLASKDFIIPYIGISQFSAIETDYNSVNGVVALMPVLSQKLLQYIQGALYNYAISGAVPTLNVQIDSAGITQQHTDHSKPAFQHAIEAMRGKLLMDAYKWLEELIGYLEENKSSYPLYANSAVRQSNVELLINTAAEFNECYPLYQKWQTFRLLRPAIKDVETFVFESILGDYLGDLKTKIAANTLNAADKKVLVYIRRALANYTIEHGVKQNWVSFIPEGVVYKEYAATFQNMIAEKTGSADMVSLKLRDAREVAERYMSKIVEILAANPLDYPVYKAWLDAQPSTQDCNCVSPAYDPSPYKNSCSSGSGSIFM